MADLQRVLMDDDTLDEQLQDRLLIGDCRRRQSLLDALTEGGQLGQDCKGSRIVQKADHQKCRGAAAGPAPAPRDPKREWPVREWEHVAHIGTGGSPCSPERFGWNSTSCTSMAGPLAR